MRLVARERPLIGPSPCVWLRLVQSMSARGGTFQSAKSPKARVGERLRLVPEFDNPHDPSAMAIYRGKTKMGFVPGSENELLALMFFYGHSDGFELRVLQVSPDQKPWEQVRVGLYVTDAR